MMVKKISNKKLQATRTSMISDEPFDRIITQWPMQEIWDQSGVLELSKIEMIDEAGITELLKSDGLRFMLADIGHQPHWIQKDESFVFWKTQLKARLCPDRPFYLEEFPQEYCYSASEWHLTSGEIVIVFFKHH